MKAFLYCVALTMFLSSCTQAPSKFEDFADESYGYDKYVDQFVMLAEKPHMVTAQSGETLADISREFDVPVSDLMQINKLKSKKIKNGQNILLTRIKFHRVKKGDNLHFIAATHGSTVEAIIVANNLDKHEKIKPGDFLTVPVDSEKKYDGQVARMPTRVVKSKPLIEKAEIAEISEATPKKALKIVNLSKSPSTNATQKTNFTWPVKGKVISKFGPGNSGLKSDGINILGQEGDFVTSASAGKVVYAGNDLKSYGNLVIIKHENDWLTAYGHMQKALVQKGDLVSRNQQIGIIGKTGDVASPQLHFAMRYLKKPVDPELYLK